MKISCEIIKDLLPLYAEGLTGAETSAEVEEHLKECGECRELYANIKKEELHGEGEEIAPLTALNRSLRKRRGVLAVFCSFVVFLMAFTLFYYLDKPQYAPYSEDLLKITETDGNKVYAEFSDKVTSYSAYVYRDENGVQTTQITAWTSIWDKITGKGPQAVVLSGTEAEKNAVYYYDCTAGGKMIALYGDAGTENGYVLPRLALGFYLVVAAAAAAVSGAAVILLRKDKEAKKTALLVFAAPLSYIAANALLRGFKTVTYNAVGDFICIIIETAAIYFALVSGGMLLKQKQQDNAPFEAVTAHSSEQN